MKKCLVLIIMALFFSCKEQEKDIKPEETHILELPKNLENQSHLDKYGLLKNIWKLSEIIGQDTTNNQEITFYKADTINNRFIYGNSIQFNIDNTFNSQYSASCGNDCFPSSTGEYFFSDENHIYIKVKNYKQGGDCEAKNIFFKSGFIQYYISLTNNNLKFIKSNGNLKDDSLNVQFSTVIDKYIEEVRNGSSSLLDYKTDAIDNISRVNEYIKNKTPIKKYEILYSKKTDDVSLINLVKDLSTNEYFFIINGFRNNYKYQVGYYKLRN